VRSANPSDSWALVLLFRSRGPLSQLSVATVPVVADDCTDQFNAQPFHGFTTKVWRHSIGHAIHSGLTSTAKSFAVKMQALKFGDEIIEEY